MGHAVEITRLQVANTELRPLGHRPLAPLL
jgi:hypothetical protein